MASGDIEQMVKAIFGQLAEIKADIAELKARPDTRLLMALAEGIRDEQRAFGPKLDRMADDMRNVKIELGAIEARIGVVNNRLNGLDDRLDHIERGVGLIQGPQGPG